MARKTEYLELHLPDENEFYDVEKDQNENFEKLDIKIKEIDNSVNSKEPKIIKNTGFNLNKSDEINLANSNILATSMAIKKVNDVVNTKEPKIIKKNGFNLDKSDNYRLNNANILLTTHGSYNLYGDLLKTINGLCPYKVGDIYITTNNQNPAVTWVGTKWQKIEGRFLRATNSGENAVTLGGSDLKILSVANLPTHSHTITLATAGNHTHTQVAHAHTQPAHSHSISVELVAEQGYKLTQSVSNGNAEREGNVTWTTNAAGGENTGAAQPIINDSGNHTHTASASNTGFGTAFDIKPAYYTVHIWRRIG
jgi:hypothetical protein